MTTAYVPTHYRFRQETRRHDSVAVRDILATQTYVKKPVRELTGAPMSFIRSMVDRGKYEQKFCPANGHSKNVYGKEISRARLLINIALQAVNLATRYPKYNRPWGC